MKSEFSKNIITLMTGTTIAQAIPIAISPILTRIYTPEDFGIFAIYLAITSIIAVIATGRYEMAIMLPKEEKNVKSILKLIIILLSIVTFVTFLIVFIFNNEITNLFQNKEISNWLYFLPISVFLVGIYQVYNYLLIREKNFKRLSTNKVIVSTTNASIQLGYEFAISNGFGLLFGNIISYIISIYFIIRSKVVNKYFHFKKNSIKEVAKEYQNFPKYDVPSVLVNVVANQLPLLALGKFFGLGVVGFYSLMYKVLMMPISLLSSTVLDVFKQRATEDYNKYGNCKDIYIKTFKSLVILGIIPFTILGIFAPEIFAFIFGKDWKVAGEFAQIMTPMIYLKMISNPLSYTFYIAKKQKIDFLGQIFLLIFIIFAIFIGIVQDDDKTLLILLSFVISIYQVLYLILSYYFSLGEK
ncbi:O-antigen translocase [Aliarcobacter butzleri RM4018]|uniref:O-antigen translocase n=1 Tax=Aliarcobacter butzleri (strain RM4018) TaxID=367737 RepID=A8ESM3_ALIB4|nr:oligosaccharide flippase family protein [Aliarcobacter butzleri]ABV66947.1 O-antigen translocase [Aliarcobacter butzleri RM4018]SNV26145.1 Lipopolysaccharide biosynthesis protein wzxC [Aliarcobacter butzleri]